MSQHNYYEVLEHDTLKWVNDIRESNNLPKLKDLPKAVRGDTHDCVIARALSGIGDYRSTSSSGTAFVSQNGYEQQYVKHPVAVAEFINRFDRKEFKKYVAPHIGDKFSIDDYILKATITHAKDVMTWKERREMKKLEYQAQREIEEERIAALKDKQRQEKALRLAHEIQTAMWAEMGREEEIQYGMTEDEFLVMLSFYAPPTEVKPLFVPEEWTEKELVK